MKKKKQENSQEACKKCEEYLQGWKRALADYENLKRDLDRVKDENRQRIRIDLAFDLLPVMDNFDIAVGHVPDLSACDEVTRKSIDVWLQGVTFIKKQFEDVFAELGIEQIKATEKFDQELHEAIEERSDKQKEEGEILQVIQNGWKIGERILRPAKVIINKIN
ncbi:nucleotide exchange factor GrpE [Patescibacteria group bacterium]|nr:nucleotide exchange factor GrpE [Patescibacteria group bacterium]MBU4452774.1 nucleotide exchange factor GrpE [Patescibacteria group bacterium]MCG2687793.1 nucleotide exchange factor GrpE [Candidatus Parcubacteria bacterium]